MVPRRRLWSFVEPEKKPSIAVVRPIVAGPEDLTESADAVVAKRELKRKQHQRHRSKLLAAFMKKKSDIGDDDTNDGGTDGKSKADNKPSATAKLQTSPAAAQAESSTSETTSRRDRAGSIGVLKELSVRQTKD